MSGPPRLTKEHVRVDVAEGGRDRFRDARMPPLERGEDVTDLAAHAVLVAAHAADRLETARRRVRPSERLAHERERPDETQRSLARGGHRRQRRDAAVEENIAKERLRAVVGRVAERENVAAELGGQVIERASAMAAA